MIDCKLLESGEKDFNQLNNVYIILIAPFDMFGYGLYRYTFVGQCIEIPELKMNDGATRIFLNTNGTNAVGVTKELIELLKLMQYTNDNSINYISQRVNKLKENVKTMLKDTEYSVKYLRFREAYYLEHKEEIEAEKAAARADARAEGLAEGRAEGRAEGTRDSIYKLLYTLSDIPIPLKNKIANQKDINTLNEWLIKASRSNSIEEFEKQII